MNSFIRHSYRYIALMLAVICLAASTGCKRKSHSNWRDNPTRDSLLNMVKIISTDSLTKRIKRTPDPSWEIAVLNLEVGRRKTEEKSYNSAIQFNKQALKSASEVQDTMLMVFALNEIALDFAECNVKDAADMYSQEAIEISHEALLKDRTSRISHKVLLHTKIYSAYIFSHTGEYDKAIEMLKKGITVAREQKFDAYVPSFEAEIGRCFKMLNQPDSAFYYYRRALRDNMEGNFFSEASCNYIQIGDIFKDRGNYDKAIEMYNNAYGAVFSIGSPEDKIKAIIPLIDAMNKAGEYEQAYLATLEGMYLSDELQSNSDKLLMYKNMEIYFSKAGDYKEACRMIHKGDSIQGIIDKEARDNTLFDVRIDYVKDKNKEEIDYITDCKDKKLKEKSIINFLLFLLFIILAIILIGSFYLTRMRLQHSKNVKKLMNSKRRLYLNLIKDFKQPLSNIMNYNEQLKREFASKDPEGNKRLLDVIEKQTHHLINLTNQMLSVDKIKKGEETSQWINGDISLFIEIMVEKFNTLAMRQDKEIVLTNKSRQIVGYYSPSILGQILNNIVIYTLSSRAGKGKIEVALAKETAGKYSITISTASKKIVSETESKGKLQFDLQFAKELTYLINGAICISNDDNKSFIKITLPIEHEKHKHPGENANIEEKEETHALSLVNNIISKMEVKHYAYSEKEKINSLSEDINEDDPRDVILIVEDNYEICKYIKKILSEDYQIITAISGKDAIEKTNEYYPDLIILNRTLEDMSGNDVCKKIKTSMQTCYIPIIMLTATGQFGEQSQLLKGGADANINKPFLEEDLTSSVSKILQLCHNQRIILEEKYSRKTKENVIGLANHSNQEDNQELIDKGNFDKDFYEKLSECISTNISDPDFDRNVMADELDLSLSQLCRKVKSLTGLSPAAYIKKIRISCAEELLLDTTKTMTEIALELGFKDYQTFLRAFKAETGYLPSEIQKNLVEDANTEETQNSTD